MARILMGELQRAQTIGSTSYTLAIRSAHAAFTVFEGGAVGDICALVHKDLIEKLRFAKLWRNRADPVSVLQNEPVRDGDIHELHL
ncbi:MAG TPA: TGS domain-containing protein [bacterium]|nr:TGS domain-containing protein [bacterium]